MGNISIPGVGASPPVDIAVRDLVVTRYAHITCSEDTYATLFERTTTNAIDTTYLTARFLARKSTDMGDEFGGKICLQIEDNADVVNTLGYIAWERDGVDNTGEIQIIPQKAGVNVTSLVCKSSGAVGIGTASPSIYADLTLYNGKLCLKETTTPTADTNYGKIYTKNDNKLYFQDGDGTEHEVKFV